MAEARDFAKLPVIVDDVCHHPTIVNNGCQSDKIQDDLGLSMPVENVVHQANWCGKIHLNFVRALNSLSGDGELARVCASIALFFWLWEWCGQLFQLLLPQTPPPCQWTWWTCGLCPKLWAKTIPFSLTLPASEYFIQTMGRETKTATTTIVVVMPHSTPEPRTTWLQIVSNSSWKNPSQCLPHNRLSFCFYLKVTLSDLSETQDKQRKHSNAYISAKDRDCTWTLRPPTFSKSSRWKKKKKKCKIGVHLNCTN